MPVPRSTSDDDWQTEELSVPLPIQTFLWSQSSPFIRPKLGKLHEATCMFCQNAPSHHEVKAASKLLEKVLVQDILVDLSPTVSDAIKALPRWRLAQASLPHVLHCTASLLCNRKDSSIGELGAAETKLLYTLHWLLLDAAEECADADNETAIPVNKRKKQYLFSVTSLQLFVYLFTPILRVLRESDFKTFRLENGLKIWGALWDHRHPDVPVFTTPVCPQKVTHRAKKAKPPVQTLQPQPHQQFGDVFLGGQGNGDVDSTSSVGGMESPLPEDIRMDDEIRAMTRENIFPETIPEETSSTEEEHVVIFKLHRESLVYKAEHPSSFLRPPLLAISDTSGATSTISPLKPDRSPDSKHRSSYGGTSSTQSPLTEPSLATLLDVAVLRCLFVPQWVEEGVYWALTFLYRRLEELLEEKEEAEAPRRRSNSLPIPKIHISFHSDTPQDSYQQHSDQSSSDNYNASDRVDENGAKVSEPPSSADSIQAKFRKRGSQLWLDLRHLTVAMTAFGGKIPSAESSSAPQPEEPKTTTTVVPPQHNLQEIQEVKTPIIELVHYGMDLAIPNPECESDTVGTEDTHHRRRSRDAGGSTRGKRKNFSELKAFVETKLRSRSEKALEKIGNEDGTMSRRSSVSDENDFGGSNWCIDGDDQRRGSRPSSALSRYSSSDQPCHHRKHHHYTPHSQPPGGSSSEDGPPTPPSGPLSIFHRRSITPVFAASGLTKGKSMPSLRVPDCPDWQVQGADDSVGAPIITVTQHTPSPSEHGGREQMYSESTDHHQQPTCQTKRRPSVKPVLTRSLTDSSIQYSNEERTELSGTTNYITYSGNIDLKVLLKAVYSVSQRESQVCSLRVSEVITHLLNFLLDMGIMTPKKTNVGNTSENGDTTSGEDSTKEKELTPIELFLACVVRLYRLLGCPHGCGDQQRTGPVSEFLRHSCQSLLTRLYRCDQSGCRKYLRKMVSERPLQEVVEFFHALCGFCLDQTSLLSPMNLDHKRPGSAKTQPDTTNVQGGYATNFGASLGGAGPKGIEGQIIACTFKGLVTRFGKLHEELKIHDNTMLYGGVRLLTSYVRESHGGVFRRVALSGLIDSAERPHKRRPKTQTTRIVRRVAVENDPYRDSPSTLTEEAGGEGEAPSGRGGRKSLFKKKNTCTSISSVLKKTSSVSSIMESQPDSPPSSGRRRHHRTGSGKKYRRTSQRMVKIVNWIRSGGKNTGMSKSDRLEGLAGMLMKGGPSVASTSRDDYHSGSGVGAATSYSYSGRKYSTAPSTAGGRPRFVTKPGAGPMSSKFSIAIRKLDERIGRIGLGRGRKKDVNAEDSPELSRRTSLDGSGEVLEANVLLVRERKLVPETVIRQGMLRFSFLLETCPPGALPDAQLMAALLDLPGSAVVARAAMLLEVSHLVHRCNKGHWPAWIRSPVGRPSFARGPRRTGNMIQRDAAVKFHAWAEALGARLEELQSIGPTAEELVAPVAEGEARRSLRQADEEEDFLDEVSVNPTGSNCPIALQLVAVQLLLEITAFLRETLPTLPKFSRVSGRVDRPLLAGWPPQTSGLGSGPGRDIRERRMSIALSSVGATHASAQSLHSINESHHGYQAERKISFALQEADNESLASSNTTLTSTQYWEDDRRRLAGAGPQGPRGPRKHGGPNSNSFKRRSLKLTKRSKDSDSDSMKRNDSINSRRKVSAVSERSDTSEHDLGSLVGEEGSSPGVQSTEEAPESPPMLEKEGEEQHLTTHMPWLKPVMKLASFFNMICTHQGYCHPYCYRRHQRASKRLLHAVRKMYGEEPELLFGSDSSRSGSKESGDSDHPTKKDKKHRKSLEQNTSSPIRRKDSFAKRDRIEKSSEMSHVLAKLGHHPGSSVHLSKDTLEGAASGVGAKKDNKEETETQTLTPVVRYIKQHVSSLFHSPLSLVCKSLAILPEEMLKEACALAWELLLESDNEVSSTAGVVLIVAGVRIPSYTSEVISRELTHSDPSVRLNAILRFKVLWRSRHQAWPRMEIGGQVTFKVTPHGIEFTLPSPKVGMESLLVVDPPWMPHIKPNVEEVTLSQIQHVSSSAPERSFITANRTRHKLQEEMVKSALLAEESKRRTERENFLLSTVPVTRQAAYEPVLHQSINEEHEEEEEKEAEGDKAPSRPSTVHTSPPMCVAQQLFPSSLCSAVLTIIHLLDDPAVTPDGVAVYQVAHQVIWSCLVEDSALFLRYFLEKLTREKQDVMIRLLRRLIRFIPTLPPQAAFALYNYMVGYVMFYVRSNSDLSHQHISAAHSILYTVVPSIQGILFKDLKQIFRKEQCDAVLLLTANIPSAKKIIVHGPGGADAGGIPSQFPIQEDTQFYQILQEALDFFGIPEDELNSYFLFDHKTNQMQNPQSFVRDFYFFKRAQYPQLVMVHMDPDEAYIALQKQTFNLKLIEIGKVLMALAVVQKDERIFDLHEELTKLPAFPRKALETEFHLYHGGTMSKEIRGVDQMHKFCWVKLTACMFAGMAGNLTYTTDLHLFINVINGSFLLHCEDSSMLRICLATYINMAHTFNNLFATNGYLFIMPTLLRVYSNYSSNKMVTSAIEFTAKQLYILHRKPFVLQMLGSVAPLLDTDEMDTYGDANKVQPRRLFDLLLSLEKLQEDPLHILELITMDKPLKALDFCYSDDSDNLPLLETLDMCVTVVAFNADSKRGHQMLTILDAILSMMMQHFRKKAGRDVRHEKDVIHHVAISMKTMIINCEPLSKNYTGPQKTTGDGKGSSRTNYRASRLHGATVIEPDDDSHSKYYSEGKKHTLYERDVEDSETLRTEFRRPRDTLLHVVAEFLTKSSARLIELNRKTGHDRPPELLDTKCHLRLAEIAHTLLKVAPYDSGTMGCNGLKRYMNEIFPYPDWSREDLRSALINILKRLDKMFNKIAKNNSVKRKTDWNAAANLLRGLFLTIAKFPYIAHLPQLKPVIQVCQSLLLGEKIAGGADGEGGAVGGATGYSSLGGMAAIGALTPPQHFCSMVIKVIAVQIVAMGVTYSLEQVCGGSAVLPTQEKTENLIMNLLLPLCMRVGCGRKDVPKLRQVDLSYALSVLLFSINPPLAKIGGGPHVGQGGTGGAGGKAGATTGGGGGAVSDQRTSSWSQMDTRGPIYPKLRPTLLRASFLGLKVLLVCFEKQLSQEWGRILHCLRDLDSRGQVGLAFWDFLDFVVSYRTPLFILMRPFILNKLKHCNDAPNEGYKGLLRGRLLGLTLPRPRSKGTQLLDLAHQVKALKEEVTSTRLLGEAEIRPSTLEVHSEVGRLPKKTKGLTLHDPVSTSRPVTMPPPMRYRRGSVRFGSRPTVPSDIIADQSASKVMKNKAAFLLKKGASSANLFRNVKPVIREGGEISFSSPNSPAEGDPDGKGTTAGGVAAADKTPLTNKHRLQRQMAQSRKTFKLRRSKYNSKGQEKKPADGSKVGEAMRAAKTSSSPAGSVTSSSTGRKDSLAARDSPLWSPTSTDGARAQLPQSAFSPTGSSGKGAFSPLRSKCSFPPPVTPLASVTTTMESLRQGHDPAKEPLIEGTSFPKPQIVRSRKGSCVTPTEGPFSFRSHHPFVSEKVTATADDCTKIEMEDRPLHGQYRYSPSTPVSVTSSVDVRGTRKTALSNILGSAGRGRAAGQLTSDGATSSAGRAAVLRVDDNQYLLTSFSDLPEQDESSANVKDHIYMV